MRGGEREGERKRERERERERRRERRRERERDRQRETETERLFLNVKILALRPTDISAVGKASQRRSLQTCSDVP